MARHWGTKVQGNRKLKVATTGKMSNGKSKKWEGKMQLKGKMQLQLILRGGGGDGVVRKEPPSVSLSRCFYADLKNKVN